MGNFIFAFCWTMFTAITSRWMFIQGKKVGQKDGCEQTYRTIRSRLHGVYSETRNHFDTMTDRELALGPSKKEKEAYLGGIAEIVNHIKQIG